MILGLTRYSKVLIATIAWAGVWYIVAIPFWGELMREIEKRGGFDKMSRRRLTAFFLVAPACVPFFVLMLRRQNRRTSTADESQNGRTG